jgi:adenylate kinase family enzyme
MLSASDPVTWDPRRLLVAGVSGVGRSTLARSIAAALLLPYTEIDSLYHGPNWTPRESFVDEVDAITREPAWVTEWQYRSVRPMLAARADTLVWLDYSFPVAFGRVVRRTWRRARTREEMWNGNTEPGMWHAITNKDGIVRWAFDTRNKVREQMPDAVAEHTHLHVVRLRSQRETDAWLAELT